MLRAVTMPSFVPPVVPREQPAREAADTRVHVVLLGKGTVGGQFLEQLASEAGTLRTRHDVDIRLVGLVASKASLFDDAGIEPERARERLAAEGGPPDVPALLDHLARLPPAVLVDCTAADGMNAIYAAAFARGAHVVTANKQVLAMPSADRDAVHAAARAARRGYRYETTVGAGLPVIETLKNLVRTGDRVALIEGALSGTLGFLAHESMAGRPLSESVRRARSLGYTEPHPRDDLSGVDVARKCLILARELGLRVELNDVVVEPFVPAHLLSHAAVDDFFDALRSYDGTYARGIEGLRDEGRVLRYVARIEAGGEHPSMRVAPVGVPADHPAARLRGRESFVAFTTARYADPPLVVRGAGAGGAVTAAGVLADVLAVAETLGAR